MDQETLYAAYSATLAASAFAAGYYLAATGRAQRTVRYSPDDFMLIEYDD